MQVLSENYDIVICGAGLAGLTLALQLRRESPAKSILILEKQAGPLPAGTHKVGESTNEGGTHLLRQLAGLKEYIETTHIKKLGLRFFGAGSRKDGFDKRFEVGDALFARNSSYQLDRGILENDMRRFCCEAGVHVVEGVSVQEIEFGEQAHDITFAYPKENRRTTVSCRWVVDAMGRRRFLQSKLKLAKKSEHCGSASWWRIQRDFDVGEMVPAEKTDWHERVFARRWYSTNHLMGPGYWVWVIPLCSGMTSIGIVSDENAHPIRERNTFDKSIAWLAEHEPDLYKCVKNDAPLDFLLLKNFAHTTTKAFSSERWCCVGEAAAFTDALYSMGSDLIAIANRITVHLIEMDSANAPIGETVELYNQVYVTVVETMTELFRDVFPAFSADDVVLLKVMWDVACYWGFFSQLVIQDVLYQDQALPTLLELAKRLKAANFKVQDAFRTASRTSRCDSLKSGFFNFGGVSQVTDLRATVTDKRGIPELARNMDFLEQLASAVCRFILTGEQDALFSNEGSGTAAEVEPLVEKISSYFAPVKDVGFRVATQRS